MRQIALFGTSADPPTAGHQAIIRWLSHHYDWVAVWASDNPLKSNQTPLAHRTAMLALLIEDIAPLRHNVALYPELSSPRTLETVEKAQQLWASAALTLALGSDLVWQLPRWYRVEDLLRQVQLLVVPRRGYSLDSAGFEQLRQLGARVALADMVPPDVSSTAYRENRVRQALTPRVEAYINREQLYSCQHAAQKKF